MAQTTWIQADCGSWYKILSDGSTLYSTNQDSNRQRDKNHTHMQPSGFSFKTNGKNVGGSNEVVSWATVVAMNLPIEDEDS